MQYIDFILIKKKIKQNNKQKQKHKTILPIKKRIGICHKQLRILSILVFDKVIVKFIHEQLGEIQYGHSCVDRFV